MPDAHFAQAMRKIPRYVRQRHNCVTPSQLVIAVPNCLAELVEYDRDRLCDLLAQTAGVEATFSKLVDQVNDVVYDEIPSVSPSTPFAFENYPDFSLRAFKYSGVGDGMHINVSPGRGICFAVGSDPPPSNSDDSALERVVNAPELSSGHFVSATTVKPWETYGGEAYLIQNAPHHQEGNMIAHAKRAVMNMQISGELRVVDAAGLPCEILRVTDSVQINDHDNPLPTLREGWARRSPRGRMYGAKYIHLYAADILELFERGEKESSQTYGAGRMLEVLKSRYPGRFNLPTETEIRSEISKLFTKSTKRKSRPTSAESRSPKRSRYQKEAEHAIYLTRLVSAHPTIKPLEGLKQFRVDFPSPRDSPPDEKIRTKISALKHKFKAKA